MIFGINCVLLLRRSDPGAGISDRWMASAEASSKRRDMRVLQALRRKPMIIRCMTRKMAVPRRIVERMELSGKARSLCACEGCLEWEMVLPNTLWPHKGGDRAKKQYQPRLAVSRGEVLGRSEGTKLQRSESELD